MDLRLLLIPETRLRERQELEGNVRAYYFRRIGEREALVAEIEA